jgi:hypothetical protein
MDTSFEGYETWVQEVGERKGDNCNLPSYECWCQDPQYWRAWGRDEI